MLVDVGAKDSTHRVAVASGRIRMQPATFRLVAAGKAKKGDVLAVARIAAIQAAKRTAELIPLAHPIALTRVAVDFELARQSSSVIIRARAECRGQTGVGDGLSQRARSGVVGVGHLEGVGARRCRTHGHGGGQ